MTLTASLLAIVSIALLISVALNFKQYDNAMTLIFIIRLMYHFPDDKEQINEILEETKVNEFL